MKCESRASLYTAIDADCNGWSGISLTECEDKCTKNEVPSKCQQQGIKCKYFYYNNAAAWCQLADETCNPVTGDRNVILTMKQGSYLL